MSGDAGLSYNQRLFAGRGLRSFLHTSRFEWVRRAIARTGTDCGRVVELGCFDGRLLGYLPALPSAYLGIDKGVEGGIDRAIEAHHGRPALRFVKTGDPGVLEAEPDGSFSAAFALETMEHIPDEVLERYIAALAHKVDGHLFVTVPNEKGLVFLAKWLVKALIYRDGEPYTACEVIASTLGLTGLVERGEHKGFDYATLGRQIGRHFDEVRLSGIPFAWLPPFLSFTVGITARSRRGR